MKIIHIAWNLSYGGAETLLVQLLNRQCRHHDVDLIIVNDVIEEGLIDRIDQRVNIHLIKRPLHNRNPFYFLKLSGLLLSIQSDIVHFHQDNLIEYIPTRFFKKNFCLTVHSVAMDVNSLHKYDHLFAISHSVQAKIKEKSGINASLIYNGIELNQFNRKKENRLQGEKWRLIQVGRLDHTGKGQHLLLHAAHQLIHQHHQTNFVIHFWGDGPSSGYLQSLANELHLNDFVVFEGSRSFDFIRENLCQYDLLVQPSLYEGFGLTAIEAMAAGVPVLASNVDGLAEIIRQNEYGYSFEKNNVEDLTHQIREILTTPKEELNALTDKAYQYAVKHFDVAVTSENYLKAYSQITGL